jgi:hypothetical protein
MIWPKTAWAIIVLIVICLWAADGANAGSLANPMDKYEATSQKVWYSQTPGEYELHWDAGEAELQENCGLHLRNLVACADCPMCGSVERTEGYGKYMRISWAYWYSVTPYERCTLHAHEYGHLLGWDHEDPWFLKSVARADQVCFQRFMKPAGWKRLK